MNLGIVTTLTKLLSEEPVNFSSRLLIGSIKMYQKYISPVRGSQCTKYSSCSEYSVRAIKKYGFFISIMMTVDRLVHESDESDYAPLVKKVTV